MTKRKLIEVKVTVATTLAVACWAQPQAVKEASGGLALGSGSRLTAPTQLSPGVSGPRRRALLVGIDDYTAADLTTPHPPPALSVPEDQRTTWPNLYGSVNDAEAMRDILVGRFGFPAAAVRVLKDREATREAVLRAIEEHLIEPAREGDVVVFHFSGHGSQVRNTKSRERDQLDESIVPADSRLGVPDIRDKELRRLFNRALAKKAQPVVILDSCHSGSGVRGLPDGSPARAIPPDLRDVADGADYGPPIEQGGALVLSASQDDEKAGEGIGDDGRIYGVFTLALLKALRAAPVGESSRFVLKRARAWLGAAGGSQRPVLEGLPDRLDEPLFGPSAGPHRGTVVAVDAVAEDGQISLLGGWVNGLATGSELRPLYGQAGAEARLRVTGLDGLRRSWAKVLGVDGVAPEVRSGQLFELVSWVAKQQPLRVWVPVTAAMSDVLRLAEGLEWSARRGEIAWVEDPTKTSPSHVLRWSGDEFELLGPENRAAPLGIRPLTDRVLELLPDGARLFVQFPASAELMERLEIGARARHSAIEPVYEPRRASYVLVGRLKDGAVQYAWIRPGSVSTDQEQMHLPVRSRWLTLPSRPENPAATAWKLRDSILRLYKVYAWNLLQSPPEASAAFPYRLAIADSSGVLVTNRQIFSGREYSLVLRTEDGAEIDSGRLRDRYVYVFAIDSFGASSLLYPRRPLNSEHKFPGVLVKDDRAPGRIDLGKESAFDVVEPFGFDTFFMLTSTEPIDDPGLVFHYEGVRGHEPPRRDALATLLAEISSTKRGVRSLATKFTWSIDRQSHQTLPAKE